MERRRLSESSTDSWSIVERRSEDSGQHLSQDYELDFDVNEISGEEEEEEIVEGNESEGEGESEREGEEESEAESEAESERDGELTEDDDEKDGEDQQDEEEQDERTDQEDGEGDDSSDDMELVDLEKEEGQAEDSTLHAIQFSEAEGARILAAAFSCVSLVFGVFILSLFATSDLHPHDVVRKGSVDLQRLPLSSLSPRAAAVRKWSPVGRPIARSIGVCLPFLNSSLPPPFFPALTPPPRRSLSRPSLPFARSSALTHLPRPDVVSKMRWMEKNGKARLPPLLPRRQAAKQNPSAWQHSPLGTCEAKQHRKEKEGRRQRKERWQMRMQEVYRPCTQAKLFPCKEWMPRPTLLGRREMRNLSSNLPNDRPTSALMKKTSFVAGFCDRRERRPLHLNLRPFSFHPCEPKKLLPCLPPQKPKLISFKESATASQPEKVNWYLERSQQRAANRRK